MAFLNRIFRNRGLLENLGRKPLAPILEPIIPRPIATPFAPPQPVLPFPERLPDPFERLPLENPRDDFLSIQRLDDTPPIQSPLKQAFKKIQNQQMPVLLPPPVIPPQPPSIGGIGGINQDPRPLERVTDAPKEDQLFISRLDDPIVRSLPVGDPISFTPPTPDPIITTDPIITDPVIEPAPTTPAAVATDVGAVPVTTIP
jgi:hypothetical protein